MFPKALGVATNTELLNQFMENVIPEFNSKPEHRNTFIEGNKLMRWVDGKSIYHMPTKVELREISDKELAVWNAYVKMMEVLSDLDKEK